MTTTRGPGLADAGRVILGDPGTRFADLTGLLLDSIARMLADPS
jgi:hypothetical protein